MTETARLVLAIDSTQVDSGTRSLDRLGLEAERAEGRATRATDSMSAGFKGLGAAMMAVATSAMFRRIVSDIASFEQAMLGVKAVSGATGEEFAALEKQARELGATSMFSAQQAAEAQRFLAMAGFQSNQILTATPGILELATAASLDLGTAADIATNALSGFRLPVEDLGRLNDVLAQTANSANTSVQQLGQALSYAAPISAAAGISLETTAAAIGALSDAGLQGSRAGTGFLGVIRQLSNVTPVAAATLEKYSLGLEDVDVTTRGLQPVLETLAKANITTADAFKIFGSEAGTAAQILMGSSERVAELTGLLDDAEGAAGRAADTLGSGLTASILAFKSAVAESVLQLGDSGLSGALKSVVDAAAGVVSHYNGMLPLYAEANDLTEEQSRNIELLAEGMRVLAIAAGGRLAGAFATMAIERAKATVASIAGARADAEAAQQAARRTAAELASAQAIYQRALADMRAVAGTSAHAHAMDNLAAAEMRAGQARAAHTAALNASTAAMARASVGARAAAGALALLGGPIGATITALAAVGYAIHTFTEGQRNARREVDEFRKSLDQAAPSLDSLIEKYREVNEVQREGLRIEWVRQQEVAAKAAEAAFVDMLNSVALETKGWSGVMKAIALDGPISGVRGLRAEFGELVAPLQEAFESGENLLPVIERIGEQEGLTSRQIDDLKQFAVEIDSARQKGEHFEELLSRLANEAPALTITPAAGDGGAGEAAASATEQFLKLESAFHQQIALYGQAGEAAKIRYQIESGALDDLLPKEREQLLALAEQYDAIVRIADAEEERQRASAAIDQRVASLQLEADTLGMTAAQAELYKLHLDGATEAQYRAAEAALHAIEMQDELATRRAEEAAYLNQLQGRLEGLEQGYASEVEKLEEKLLTERQILLESYEAQLIDREEYQARLSEVNQHYYDNVEAARQKDVARETQANQSIAAARMAAYQSGLGLLQVFAQENEAVAYIVLGVQTALSAAMAWQNTLAAQTRALAELGPIAGPPAAAKIGAWGKLQVGMIVATGLAQGIMGGGSVGGPGGGTGAGGSFGGGFAEPPSPLPPQEYQPGGGVTVIIQGDVTGFNLDDVSDAVTSKVIEGVESRDVMLISPNSRNGRMLSGR